MIIFILPSFSGGGAERVSINLIKALNINRHSVGIIVFEKSGKLLSMVPGEIPIYNLGTKTLKRSIVPLLMKLYNLRPNVIFSTFGYVNIALLATCWLLPYSHKLWIREANLPSVSLSNNKKHFLMKLLYRLLYRYADCTFSTSEKMSDDFIYNFNVPKSKIKILPNPINEKEIRSKSIPMIRRDSNAVHFVAAGRLTYQKGFDRLLEWFATLDSEKYTLTILGAGPLMKSLNKSIKHLGIEKQVVLVGFNNNPWQWYAGADAFLLSSRWEGMPNAVLESLACGTPVIATFESGGVDEVARCTLNSAVTVVNNSSQFIQAMKRVVQSENHSIKPSLLPRKYEILSVVSVLENMLKDVSE